MLSRNLYIPLWVHGRTVYKALGGGGVDADKPSVLVADVEAEYLTDFRRLCDLCLRLFRAPNLNAEDIVDIRIDDAVSVRPHGGEGVRVAFTLTYPGINKLDGPTQLALEHLLRADGDGP